MNSANKAFALLFSLVLSSLVLSTQVFAQSINCKISSTSALSASYDEHTHNVHVIKTENSQTIVYSGVSYDVLSKVSVNKNIELTKIANDALIDLSSVNTASVFVLQKTSEAFTELVDYVNVNAESIGTAVVFGSKIQRCL